ncbi:MAG: flagellar protein FlaG [Bacillota bacterium]
MKVANEFVHVAPSNRVSGEQTKSVSNETYTDAKSALGISAETVPGLFQYTKIANESQIIKAIEEANKSYYGIYTRFEFSIHDDTKEIMVKVIDQETNEVIREIPPEKILDMVATMWELAGLIVDEKI